jgi:hypothetical protein
VKAPSETILAQVRQTAPRCNLIEDAGRLAEVGFGELELNGQF